MYFTVAPVWSSHGLIISRKAVSSSPPQVPMTVTSWPEMSSPPVPPEASGAGVAAVLPVGAGPVVPLGVEQAAIRTAPASNGRTRHRGLVLCIRFSL